MNRLERIPSQKVIGGVAAGLAAYLRTDVALIRVLFVLGAVFTHAPFIIGYVILWIALPKQSEYPSAPQTAEDMPQHDTSRAWGIVAIIFGVLFLLDEFTWWFSWHNFWPVLFIGLGVGLIFKDQIKERIAS
ncbi:MAG: PspC domain-containing protein [Siphonobacter sp.]